LSKRTINRANKTIKLVSKERIIIKNNLARGELRRIGERVQKEYKVIRNNWRKERKSTEWKDTLSKWKKNPHKLMGELMNEDRKGDPESVIDPETNSLTSDPERVMEIFTDTIKQKIGTREEEMTQEPEYQIQMEEENKSLRGSYKFEKRFEKREVKKILQESNYDTAGGEDAVTIGLLKAAVMHAPKNDDTALEMITEVVQRIFDAEGELETHRKGIVKILWKKKGDRRRTNIRPLTLTNAISKLTSKIMADRITEELCERNILHPANEGFLKDKGTGHAINTILNIWEDARENKKEIYNMLYDVSGAYDAIPHETIKRGMKILQIPKKTQNYIMNKMKNSTLRIKTKHGLTEAFDIKKGVAQGCPLSPIIYIIAMNPLHVGLEKNPLYGGARDGYVMVDRKMGNDTQIGSKGYADDTAIASGSIEGMRRMTQWVNYFCIKNRISMNRTKSQLFGRNNKGEEMTQSFEIVTQGKIKHSEGDEERKMVEFEEDGTTHTKTTIEPMRSDSNNIKYLGVYINMDINWEKQISAMSQLIGMHASIAAANRLTPEMTTFLFNKYLKPKLEYRMQFADIPEKKLKTWDSLIIKTVSDKIGNKNRTRAQAIQLVLGLELPSNYYHITQTIAYERAINEKTDMGKTSRIRMREGECSLCQLECICKSKKQKEQERNRMKKQRQNAEANGIIMAGNRNWNREIPSKLEEGQRKRRVEIQGQDIELPEDHFGTWGVEMEERTITIATDGSLTQTNKANYRKWGKEKKETKAGWSMLVIGEWFEKNWERLHEDKHRLQRIGLIEKHIQHWGGIVEGANSSFHPELVALIKAMMIFPITWKINWITDSMSAILAFEAANNTPEKEGGRNYTIS
jgi:hypothetical protein